MKFLPCSCVTYSKNIFNIIIKGEGGEFPRGLVVRILFFHCCGPGSIPDQGIEIPQAMQCDQKHHEIILHPIESLRGTLHSLKESCSLLGPLTTTAVEQISST